MVSNNKLRQGSAGFTVLELMVATSVFAVVMLVLTAGVLAFSRDYFRSINQSNTQATARDIMNDIAQNLQFGQKYSQLSVNGAVPKAAGICVDQTSFSYMLGGEVVSNPSSDDQLKHGLVKATGGDCGGVSTVLNLKNDISTSVHNQQELLGDHMRLGAFSVEPLGGGTYNIHVEVIYGDFDLMSLNGSDVAEGQAADPSWWLANGDQVHCKGGAGSQFCAVSDLSTTVQTRLAGS